MNAFESEWISIGAVTDIPREGARCVDAGALRVAVFRTAEDDVYAIEDRCPHRGGPLSQGIVHGGCVTCPLHNMVIALDTGEAQGADEGHVTTFRTQVRDGIIFIAASDIASIAQTASAA
ncbi:nitrite reductase small subunit NirD [Notoacmeibacter sp. MSK16QG-6]|uniref:nitrite reductase small subunit NirD n=1 Tax=Notoacmeibacter sp. MSK16QG-6 TaxID=2957982 RepID=UPI0020A05893|nr:nitrite reductase small subunit NirD [Notoacmeibacter sp. MSK16QG-6]MCP1199671.1 nitrite reductase small subunit NirD [Notoacmeibacter sp. MSK16QG-6]